MKFTSALITLALMMPCASFAEEVVIQGSKAVQKPGLDLQLDSFSLDSQTFVFPSGLRVIMQADHSQPLVAITTYVDHGSTSDPVGKEGIAHFVEHLWFRSKHGDLPKIWDVLSELGCNLNASTADDWTNYMTVAPASSLESLIKLESLRLTAPVEGIQPEVVAIEREVIRNELRMRYENSWMMAMPFLFEKLYPEGHPYSRLGIGTHDSLNNIELADIQKFTQDYYRPENTTITIVGDFNINDAAQILLRNFEPTLFSKDITEDDIGFALAEGVTAASLPKDVVVGDPEYFDMYIKDPADPTKPLQLIEVDGRGISKTKGYEPRVSGAAAEPPKPVDTKISEAFAATDDPIVVVAWTVPGGYRDNEATMNVAANMASNAMGQFFASDPKVKHDPDFNQAEVGCFPWISKIDSKLMCLITLNDESVNADLYADRAIDQLAGIYASEAQFTPELQSYMQSSMQRSRNSAMASTLLSLDLVSSLDGRATQVAQHAHFTSSGTYHTDQLQQLNGLDMDAAKQFVFKYMKRDRAVRLFLRPLPEDDRTLDTSNSDWAGASGNVIDAAIDPASVTPAVVLENMVVPDVSLIKERTLSNGMRVVIMPHGEAPIVTARLLFKGGPLAQPRYLDAIAEDFSERLWTTGSNPDVDPLRIAGEWRNDDGQLWSSMGMDASSANLDGALWMLRELDASVSTRTSAPNATYTRTVSRKPWFAERLARSKRTFSSKGAWMTRLNNTLIPNHPMSESQDYEFWQRASTDFTPTVIKDYLAAKYSPANTTLLIVGYIHSVDDAFEQAEAYFGDLNAPPTTTKIDVKVPPPTTPGPSGVYVFDKPKSTQTDVSFRCAIEPDNGKNKAARELLGDLLDERAWQILREESGVTYGAGAYTRSYPGGYAMLGMNSLVQADSGAVAAKVFDQIIQEAKEGKLDEGRLALLKLNRAKKYVLGQQSVDQMTGRLESVLTDPDITLSYFADYADQLANVTMADVVASLGDCDQHRIMILEGQKDNTARQLTEAKIDHVIFDWKAEGDKLYEAADPKGFAKYAKKRAKSEAKEEKAKAKKGESTEEGTEEAAE